MAMLGRKRVQKILIFHYKGPTIFIPIWTIWKNAKDDLQYIEYVSLEYNVVCVCFCQFNTIGVDLLSKLIGFVMPIRLPVFI